MMNYDRITKILSDQRHHYVFIGPYHDQGIELLLLRGQLPAAHLHHRAITDLHLQHPQGKVSFFMWSHALVILSPIKQSSNQMYFSLHPSIARPPHVVPSATVGSCCSFRSGNVRMCASLCVIRRSCHNNICSKCLSSKSIFLNNKQYFICKQCYSQKEWVLVYWVVQQNKARKQCDHPHNSLTLDECLQVAVFRRVGVTIESQERLVQIGTSVSRRIKGQNGKYLNWPQEALAARMASKSKDWVKTTLSSFSTASRNRTTHTGIDLDLTSGTADERGTVEGNLGVLVDLSSDTVGGDERDVVGLESGRRHGSHTPACPCMTLLQCSWLSRVESWGSEPMAVG